MVGELMSEKWISIVEYARHHNVSDMTVRRRIKTGKLRSVLKEGKYYVLLSSQPEEVLQPPNPRRSSWQSGENNFSNSEQTNFSYPSAPQTRFEKPNTQTDNKLVAFCELALKKLSDSEKWLEEKYQSQVTSLQNEMSLLQEKLKNKNEKEIELKQKIEDLQTLLQLVEQKN
jgi:hypothetical protein